MNQNDRESAYRYVFTHSGMPVPFCDPEIEKEVMEAWKACDCRTCETPCIHKDLKERFPKIVEGGKQMCARYRELSEPFTWVDSNTGEVFSIPEEMVYKIVRELAVNDPLKGFCGAE